MLIVGACAADRAWAQSGLSAGTIVITEFFEELMRINPSTGAKTVMPDGAFDPRDILAIDAARRIVAIDEADRLVRFNPATLTVTPLTSTLFPLAVDLAIEPSGNVLVVDNQDLFRVNIASGMTTTLVNHENVNGGFFSPRGITVGPTGRVFLTEFFEQAWEYIPASGMVLELPLPEEVTLASVIDARSDGDLIVRDFDVGDLLRIDPDTGDVTTFATGIPALTHDFALEADDDVVLTSSEGVFRYAAASGAETPLTIDATFFEPLGIAVAPAEATTFAAADFNRDGDVDAADLTAWGDGFGKAAGANFADGNADGDADVDGADFLVWQRQYGMGAGAAVAAAAVPEPAAWVMALGAAAVGWRRRGA
ncbi:MAG TPA: hypothetical protein VF175_05725 [Lacipirellula sp.]